jgi:hypothetical protein
LSPPHEFREGFSEVIEKKKTERKSNKIVQKIMGLSQMGLKKQKNVKIDLDNPNF